MGTTLAPGGIAFPPPPPGVSSITDDERTMSLCGTLTFKASGVHLSGKVVEAAIKTALLSVMGLSSSSCAMRVHADSSAQDMSLNGATCMFDSPPYENVAELPAPPPVQALFLKAAETWLASYIVTTSANRVGDLMASIRHVSDDPGSFVEPLMNAMVSNQASEDAPQALPSSLDVTAVSPLSTVTGHIETQSFISGIQGQLVASYHKAIQTIPPSIRRNKLFEPIAALVAACMVCLCCCCCCSACNRPKRGGMEYEQVGAGHPVPPPPYTACLCCGKILWQC
jgi:hypothetical protein